MHSSTWDEKPVNDPIERERERESWGTMNWVIYEGGFIQDKISTLT